MSAPAQDRPPGLLYAVYALGVVFLANFLNYLDRFVASGSEEGIRASIKMGDDTWGWVYAAFTVGYLVASPFVGALSDRGSRPRIFAFCVGVWSLATLGCGVAREVWQLILLRGLIGVGEAGCLAIGPALVADFFAPRARGRAMSLFFAALPLGAIAGFVLAAHAKTAWGDWRQAFYYAGLPGLALMLVIAILRDPPRGAHEGLVAGHGSGPRASLGDYAALLKTPTLLLNMLAQAFAAFAIIPLVHFGKKFFLDRGWPEQEITTVLALGMGAGIVGSLASGWLGDRLVKRHAGAYSGIAAAGFLGGLPLIWVAVLVPHRTVAAAALIGTFLLYFACMPAVNAQIAQVTHPLQRSMAYAMAVFVLHILGDTISPPLFGRISQEHGRAFAFGVFPLALIGSGLLCLIAMKTATRDARRSQGAAAVAAA